MQINSLNAWLTSDAIEKAQRWDRHQGPKLQLVCGGGEPVVLARGLSAGKVLRHLRPLLGEVTPRAARDRGRASAEDRPGQHRPALGGCLLGDEFVQRRMLAREAKKKSRD